MSDVGKGVCEKTADDLLHTVHHVPVRNNLSLLVSPVPDRSHDQESRLADGLEDTQKGSANHERREAEAEGMAS
jgi:hypothetical protein